MIYPALVLLVIIFFQPILVSAETTLIFEQGTSNTLTNNLVAYWKLDETLGMRLDSIGSNNLTSKNDVLSNLGKKNQAAQFTAASSQYLSISDNPELSTGDIDFTVAGWVLLDNKVGFQGIAGKGVTGQFEYRLYYNNSADRFIWVVYDLPGNAIASVAANNLGAPSTGTWYFIVAWHDSVNNRIGIEVNNGLADTSPTIGIPGDGTAPFELGQVQNELLNGRLDEFGFWKRILTSQEKSDLYNGGNGNTLILGQVSGLTTSNPLWFGAKGDNVTDDGPAFQKAIDVLLPGGTLKLNTPTIKYAIATGIIINKPITVSGDGWSTIVRANSNSITSIFTVGAGGDGSSFSNFRIEGSKNGAGGTVQRGIYFNGAKNGLVQNVLFSGPTAGTGLNFGVDINSIDSGGARIQSNKFERLVSSSGNGAAILIEASSFNQVMNNVIDSSEFNAATPPSAAIFLSAQIGGVGSTDNVIANNIIHDHPQVGIAINSTTYFEFGGNLGACDRNTITNNEIYNSKSSRGGDASSGIVVMGNSSSNSILNNKVHHNGHAVAGGYGIVIAGSKKGTPEPGQPKMDEAPNLNEIRGNQVYNNQDDGIRIKGATNTSIIGNSVSDNGQRTLAGFRNVYITDVGGQTNGSNTIVAYNNLMSSQLAYQIGIGLGVANTKISKNFYEGGAKGVVEDLGISTLNEGSVSQPNTILL